MNTFRLGYTRILFLTGIALVLLTLGIEYFQYQQKQQLLLTDLKNRLIEHTANVNLRARTVRGYVNGLRIAAENSLYNIKRFGVTSPLFTYLKNDPANGTYFLDVQDTSLNKTAIGNLIGKGTLEGLSDKNKAEVNMALTLIPFFEIALKNTRGTVWISYRSINHFQTLYPWVPTQRVDSIIRIQGNHHDSQKNYWTKIHGPTHSGFVVTNSSSIYDQDSFLGTVSLDLSLTELNRVMNRFQPLDGSMYLINQDQQVLATAGVNSPLIKENKLLVLSHLVSSEMMKDISEELKNTSNWFRFNGKNLIYVAALHETPWYIVYLGNKSNLFLRLFYEAINNLLVISFILIFVVGLGYMIVIRNFIKPAEKLIAHIENENQGLQSAPKNLPKRWRNWFDIVSRIFAENRSLLVGLENRVKQRTKQLEKKNIQLENALLDLKKAQSQIIIQEKLASLGALTAGIAHEIKNPLNFILNFSDLSLEYVQELKEKVRNNTELFDLIEQNITKTIDHAKRADSIVKGMLAHARGKSDDISNLKLNSIVDEAVDLAYGGFQGQEGPFAVKIIKDFDQNLRTVQGSKQDISRVFLNIINNACFAMHEKKREMGAEYEPELIIRTKNMRNKVAISFEDNGPGMTKEVMKKIYLPFFSTKESGKGTGLGLSLSYDIITLQHHGELKVESEPGKFTIFIIELPMTKEDLNE